MLRRLVLAIRSACGIEALIWLTDVAGLSRRHASELMRWSALALLRAALAEAGERRGRRDSKLVAMPVRVGGPRIAFAATPVAPSHKRRYSRPSTFGFTASPTPGARSSSGVESSSGALTGYWSPTVRT
jgi:hypothetical protein